MIVKIQLPLSTNEPVPLALVYNEDRSFETRIPASQVQECFADDCAKLFFEAHLEDDPEVPGEQRLFIDADAEWQDW